jgi:hypothetical protein
MKVISNNYTHRTVSYANLTQSSQTFKRVVIKLLKDFKETPNCRYRPMIVYLKFLLDHLRNDAEKENVVFQNHTLRQIQTGIYSRAW